MSKRYSLNKQDLKKIGIGSLIAIAGALLTYCSEIVGEIDWGVYTPVVVSIAGILINAGRKFLTGKS